MKSPGAACAQIYHEYCTSQGVAAGSPEKGLTTHVTSFPWSPSGWSRNVTSNAPTPRRASSRTLDAEGDLELQGGGVYAWYGEDAGVVARRRVVVLHQEQHEGQHGCGSGGQEERVKAPSVFRMHC
jgi:hypothetical protein